jgi:hypothetical protein
MSNLWAERSKELGVSGENFVELAASDGKLTRTEEDSDKETSHSSLLKELEKIESGKKKLKGSKKFSISLDAVTYLKLQIMLQAESEKSSYADIPVSKFVGEAVKSHFESNYRKTKKQKAP